MSGGCFGQQRRGHGAGLGADRQQLVTGGNYPKAKHVPFHKNVPFKRNVCFFMKFSSARTFAVTKLNFWFLQSKHSIAGQRVVELLKICTFSRRLGHQTHCQMSAVQNIQRCGFSGQVLQTREMEFFTVGQKNIKIYTTNHLSNVVFLKIYLTL